eukprot:3481475-Pyramimonas_sp.AAC.1
MVDSEDPPAAGLCQRGAAAALSALCGTNLRCATDLAYVIRAQALRNREVAARLPQVIAAAHDTILAALDTNS